MSSYGLSKHHKAFIIYQQCPNSDSDIMPEARKHCDQNPLVHLDYTTTYRYNRYIPAISRVLGHSNEVAA